MRVLVVTVVHHPEDARILHRQARALVDAGHEVVLAAPYSARGVTPRDWVEPVDLPRSTGRRRLRAVRAARAAIRAAAPSVDLVLLHDPELLLAVAGVRHELPPVVWDVHEDTAAALTLKAWLPPALRPLTRRLVRATEHRAEETTHLVLAERAYAGRFRRPHLVVPNDTTVPARVPTPGEDRVVYVGAMSRARGIDVILKVAPRLRSLGIRTELIGPADAAMRPVLARAVANRMVTWHGFLPSDVALARVGGALAGLSLLHDEANYRHSLPTKVIEYLAHGVPVVTTPLPEAARLVCEHEAGVVVPYDDPDAVVAAVTALRNDPARRIAAGARGHAAMRHRHHWPDTAVSFVAQLERWAAGPDAAVSGPVREGLPPVRS